LGALAARQGVAERGALAATEVAVTAGTAATAALGGQLMAGVRLVAVAVSESCPLPLTT